MPNELFWDQIVSEAERVEGAGYAPEPASASTDSYSPPSGGQGGGAVPTPPTAPTAPPGANTAPAAPPDASQQMASPDQSAGVPGGDGNDDSMPGGDGDADDSMPKSGALDWLLESSSAQSDQEMLRATATKLFSPAEQQVIINEGQGGPRAGNLGALELSGTHYIGDDEDDLLW